jgi:hypothetical protein
MVKNFCIIGAGWYGCHIGLYLKELGHNVIIYEKERKIFNGASGFNQFRLHKGFHYPRSSETIIEAKKNFKKFNKKYRQFIFYPKNNIYCIANKESLIDFDTYIKILTSHKLNYKIKKFSFLKNVQGSVISDEGVLLNKKIINFFKKKLKNEIVYNCKIKSIKKIKKKYNFIIDCTNNTFKNNIGKNVKYILTLSHIYKKNIKKLLYPVTIMDGKLASIYPYAEKKSYFTLTHSEYTHIKNFKSFSSLIKFSKKISKSFIKKNRFLSEKSISNFYLNFVKYFSYKGFFFSYKIIEEEKSDKRGFVLKKDGNIISICSPKIANIFSAQEAIANIIK